MNKIPNFADVFFKSGTETGVIMKMIQIWMAVFFASSAIADVCPYPTLDAQLNLTLPCLGVSGVQYQATLEQQQGASTGLTWRLDQVSASQCDWDVFRCATADENLRLTIPSIALNGDNITANLELLHDPSEPGALIWKYVSHSSTQTSRGTIDNLGTLPLYEQPPVVDGKGRKLLAIYMVGSNLESGSAQAATSDLFELIGGYRSLSSDNIDVVVAFGGSTKSNWQGMKIADMSQLLSDSNDARFGNAENYLYRADRANMGDVSSLRLFLRYLNDAYTNHDQKFLAFWDHGASYKGFGNDEIYNMKPLSLPDIRQALTDSAQHFDLIGFDACLMASLETATYLHGYADYLLASEDLEPGHGWNWTQVITHYAGQNDVEAIGRPIIDNYVDDASHPYRSTGKTLSLIDLSRFPDVDRVLKPILTELTSKVTREDELSITALDRSLTNARGYSGSYNISLDIQDFMGYLQNSSNDSALKNKITPLLDTLSEYVLYTRHDGSRPYTYGVSIDRPDSPPYQVAINQEMTDLQKAWQQAIQADAIPPRILDYNDNVELKGIINVTEEELKLLRQYIGQSGLTSDFWWEQAYVIMSDLSTTLDDKLTAIAALENQSGGIFDGRVIRNFFLNKGVELVRVEVVDMPRRSAMASMVAARSYTPSHTNGRNQVDFLVRPLDVAVSDTTGPSLDQQKRQALPASQALNKQVMTAQNSSFTSMTDVGSRCSFGDTNPVKVTAVYGTLYYDPDTGLPDSFDTFSELEAYATQESQSYFSYSWNRMWHTVKYSPNQSSLWLPLRFSEKFWKEGEAYTIYTGEIYYRNWQAIYPEPETGNSQICESKGLVERNGKCYQQAALEVHLDTSNTVVNQYVKPYQLINDKVQYDKESTHLKSGDEAWFLFDSFGLEPGSSYVRLTNTYSNPIVFNQEPEFGVDMMSAVSVNTFLPKKFYFALRATDIAGNSTISHPVLAITPMPSCSILKKTEQNATDAVDALADETPITFVSQLGDSLDQAASVMMVIAEAEEDEMFLADVTTLYSDLYNTTTFDQKTTDWIWGSRVDWKKIKSELEGLMPTLTEIVQRECEQN